jgi:hypothetical protein
LRGQSGFPSADERELAVEKYGVQPVASAIRLMTIGLLESHAQRLYNTELNSMGLHPPSIRLRPQESWPKPANEFDAPLTPDAGTKIEGVTMLLHG